MLRYPINQDIADDFLTETWFIIMLGSIIAIIVFLFVAFVVFKRHEFIKQSSVTTIVHGEFLLLRLLYNYFFKQNTNIFTFTGNHAIGTVRQFPTLPLNANGVWIDPSGGVWRQTTSITSKGGISNYAPVAQTPKLPIPDYEM